MSSSERSVSPSTHRGRASTQPTSEHEDTGNPSTDDNAAVRRIPALEACGRYLLRCVHPFIVPDTLLVVAREKVCPGSCYKYKYLTSKIVERYDAYSEAALSFNDELRTRLGRNDLVGVEYSLSKGIGNGRSGDISRLKTLTARLASNGNAPLPLVCDSKSDRGFNNNATGRMLIPIEYLKKYDENPIDVRAKVNSGSQYFKVTGGNPPAFLFEDPDNYDPKNGLSGLMRGYFLTRCLRAIFTGPRTAMNVPTDKDQRSRRSVAELSTLKAVSVPVMVYVAMVARHSLSTQTTWSGKDGTFDYQNFAEFLFKIFAIDEEWTAETIQHWNLELFGNEDGVGTEASTDYSPDSFLARVKYQTEERRNKRQETQQPIEQASLENRDGEDDAHSDLSDLSREDPLETQHFPPVSPTGENRQSAPPRESNAEDDAGITPVVPPTQREKRRSEEADNGIGDDQEDGHETQARSAKRRKTARSEPQAKPKPKPKPRQR